MRETGTDDKQLTPDIGTTAGTSSGPLVRAEREKIMEPKQEITLYFHRTDGGAEYYTDKFIVCANGDKEGIFEGASIILRIDGDPEVVRFDRNN